MRKFFYIAFFLCVLTSCKTVQQQDGTGQDSMAAILSNEYTTCYAQEQCPFELVNNLIVVQVKINDSNENYRFVLDTGAGATVIKKTLADKLGIKIQGSVHGNDYSNSASVDVIRLNTISIGNLRIDNCGAVVLPLDILEKYRIDGTIGTNILKHFVVKIDYSKKEIYFLKDIDSIDTQSYRMKLRYNDGKQILTDIVVGNKTLSAIIDTGFAGKYYLSIPEKEYQANPAYFNKIIDIKGVAAMGAIGRSVGMLSCIKSISIGGYAMENLPVLILNTNSAVIGSNLLSYFTVYLDYGKMEMLLLPLQGKPFDRELFTTGIGFDKRSDGTIYVSSVFEGSEADKEGVCVGDEVSEMLDRQNNQDIKNTYTNYLEKGISFTAVIKTAKGEKTILIEKYNVFSN